MDTKRKVVGLLTGLIFCVFNASTVQAGFIYTYDGNFFTTFSPPVTPPPGAYDGTDKITGSFELAALLPANQDLIGTPPPVSVPGGINVTPLAYTFSDGRQTFTLSNSTITWFNIGTDALGNMDEWEIQLFRPSDPMTQTSGLLRTQNSFYNTVDFSRITDMYTGNIDQGRAFNNPGAWSVPEPSTLALLGIGMLGLGVVRKRNKQK